MVGVVRVVDVNQEGVFGDDSIKKVQHGPAHTCESGLSVMLKQMTLAALCTRRGEIPEAIKSRGCGA